ncbi:MAG: exopolysaccharide biosynthesis protein, partial [Deltaproteobacteria bacterium]|nr:exopolysaccharide biosynthesis protein [Deltaproteobacteria bacterium]
MVDIHCHILPGVDDGPKDWSTTLEMCRMAINDGIQHIVATPHASPRYPYDRERHQASLEELQTKVPGLKFTLGCDFYVSYDNIDALVQNPQRYTIGQTRYLLAEFSDFGLPAQFKDQIFQLHYAGVTTVITHPERNPICTEYHDLTAQLVDMGCLIQITGDSLLGAWGRVARKAAEKYLGDGL